MIGEVTITLTAIFYLINIFICLVGFFIFVWWWVRQRTASEVYAYITFLLLTTAIEKSFSLIVENLINTQEVDMGFISTLWMFRTLPGTFLITLIVSRMACRAFRTFRLERRYARTIKEPKCLLEETAHGE